MKEEHPFDAWRRENADKLKQADEDGNYTEVLKTGEITVASNDTAIFLCGHHTRLASVELKEFWAMVSEEPDPADLKHREGALYGLVQYLRDRLYPVFSRPDVFDTDGRYKKKFDDWESIYPALVALAGYPPANGFKSYIEQFRGTIKEVEGIIDEMLAELDCEAYSSLTI